MNPTPTTSPSLAIDRDGVIEISTTEQATALAAHLTDPARDRPMVVVSTPPSAGWVIDADAIYDAVTPLARVARLRSTRAAYALSDGLPVGTAVYGSAARVYPTGTTWAADPDASLLKVARSEHRLGEISHDLVEAALAAGYIPAAKSTCTCDRTKALNAEVRELQRQIRTLQDRITRATAPTPRMPQRQAPIADPAARFRAEVDAQWQQRVAAADPTATPLPTGYLLDAGFLASLDRLTPSLYRKAASVAMEILTGRVNDLPGRNVHRLRTGTGGNNPDQRTATGQVILRANLQTNSPAARRIHWTLTADGQIALLAVTDHDQQLAA